MVEALRAVIGHDRFVVSTPRARVTEVWPLPARSPCRLRPRRRRCPGRRVAVYTSRPDRWIGTGTPRSCTSRAVVRAVATGGVITFSCGPDPVTIHDEADREGAQREPPRRARRRRQGHAQRRRQAPHPLSEHLRRGARAGPRRTATTRTTPHLTVQNLTFADGNSTGETVEGGGGGAIFVRGGRFKVVKLDASSATAATGPAPTSAAAPSGCSRQYHEQPVYVVNSTFARAGVCSNGGALSSIGVSWSVCNSVFSHNHAIGSGANPARPGTPGGGSGRRHLQRRQRLHACGSPARSIERQPRARGRRRGLLRQQRPHRHHRRSENSTLRRQPQRRLRDRAPASSSSA